MEILVKTEKVADQIIQNKQEIVALDKRRQNTREALRDLDKSDENKTWITIGSLLVKVDKKKGLELLKRGKLQVGTLCDCVYICYIANHRSNTNRRGN